MTNTISIHRLSGDIFQKLSYNTILDLTKKLKNIIKKYDSDIHITLLINENILNDYDIFNDSILLEEYDFITVTLY